MFDSRKLKKQQESNDITTTQCRTNMANVLQDVLKIAKNIAINLHSFECDNDFENMFEEIKSRAGHVNLILLVAEPNIIKDQILEVMHKEFPKAHLVLYGNKADFKSVCEVRGSQVDNASALPAMLMDVASDIIIEVFLGKCLGRDHRCCDWLFLCVWPYCLCVPVHRMLSAAP